MTPDPKPKKVKLSKKDYALLRKQVYDEQEGCCLGCGYWVKPSHFSLHHKNRAVGDVRSNVDGYCLGDYRGVRCHPD
jgi:hypothetical protein